MKREERVKRYMEILNKNEKNNSSRNWEILDELSDDELFNDTKIEECIKLITEINKRLENNINKYPDYIMEYVRQNLGLDKYDTSEDKDINEMSKSDIFEKVCNWNNLYWYSEYIKSWVKDIYGIDLDKEWYITLIDNWLRQF